jgi:ferritin-like metal-binding protein YciE
MADKDLKALFLHQLKDTYFAENAILKALPKMAQAARSDELRGAFGVHLEETRGQVRRLDDIFRTLQQAPEGVECKAIQGIIAEGEEIMSEFEGGEAMDAGLISAAQAVEHYEITRYGTLKTWAQQLGLSEAVTLLDQTLQEEKETDELLTRLAGARVNAEAA